MGLEYLYDKLIILSVATKGLLFVKDGSYYMHYPFCFYFTSLSPKASRTQLATVLAHAVAYLLSL